MLALINSTVHQAGVSTMAHSIAYTYSNWVNRPVLIVSIKSDNYYKSKANVKPEYVSKFLSIINGNTGSHGDLINYTYKINDLLYYCQAHSIPSASETQRNLELLLFLERASREFGVVFLDLDHKTNDIIKFLDIADVCFNVMPPDKMILRQAQEEIDDVLESYKESGGLAVKTKMFYILNKKHKTGLSKSEAAKLLKVEQKSVFDIPFDVRVLNEANNNKLTQFLSETLNFKKTPDDKVLEVSFKRIFDVMKTV